jgi:hypothetical protein
MTKYSAQNYSTMLCLPARKFTFIKSGRGETTIEQRHEFCFCTILDSFKVKRLNPITKLSFLVLDRKVSRHIQEVLLLRVQEDSAPAHG